MIVNIQKDINKIKELGFLELLLSDKTSGDNIVWATDAYAELGDGFSRSDQMTAMRVMGKANGGATCGADSSKNRSIIKTRAQKDAELKATRTKAHAEVFTPNWVVKMMVDYADEEWFREGNSLSESDKPIEKLVFDNDKSWQDYVEERRLEIACGEAPFLVSRYDAATGKKIAIKNRVGILDRKLRVIGENCEDDSAWKEWALKAYQSVYGYEFQGDNVFIARVNLLMSYIEYFKESMGEEPSKDELKEIAGIIVWNIWQMDGLTGRIPYSKPSDNNHQLTIFEMMEGATDDAESAPPPDCVIYDWRLNKSVTYNDCR